MHIYLLCMCIYNVHMLLLFELQSLQFLLWLEILIKISPIYTKKSINTHYTCENKKNYLFTLIHTFVSYYPIPCVSENEEHTVIDVISDKKLPIKY